MPKAMLDGQWSGRFEYDDPKLTAGSSDFVWGIKIGWLGAIRGECTDNTGDVATLRGQNRHGRVRLKKTYARDPSRKACLGEDGSLYTWLESIRLPDMAAFVDHVVAIRTPYGDTQQDIEARLADDLAVASRTIMYEGIINGRRMEGRWQIPAVRLAWADLEFASTEGRWWAERMNREAGRDSSGHEA